MKHKRFDARPTSDGQPGANRTRRGRAQQLMPNSPHSPAVTPKVAGLTNKKRPLPADGLRMWPRAGASLPPMYKMPAKRGCRVKASRKRHRPPPAAGACQPPPFEAAITCVWAFRACLAEPQDGTTGLSTGLCARAAFYECSSARILSYSRLYCSLSMPLSN